MSGVFKVLLVCLLFCIAYLALWPVAVNPKAWQVKENAGYVDDFATNTKLDNFEALSTGDLSGPEAAVQAASGELYATTHEGWIVRWSSDKQELEQWVNVDGRPLGLDFDDFGNLWVANAYLGLQKVTPAGVVSLELEQVDGKPLLYADDLAIAANGKIYFSDASTRFSAKEAAGTLEASYLDIMEHSDNGRIIEFDPKTGESITLLDGLTFANGVAIDKAGRFLLVAETGEYRVHKISLEAASKGQATVVIDNLPGFPDNVHIGQNGRFWVGLAAPRSKVLDDLAAKPFWRKVVQRLPIFMRPKAVHYGMVLAIDENGKVLANLQSPSGRVYTTTGVAETDQHIYVTSLTAPFLAKYDKQTLGLR